VVPPLAQVKDPTAGIKIYCLFTGDRQRFSNVFCPRFFNERNAKLLSAERAIEAYFNKF